MVLLLLPPFYTLLDPIPSQTPFSLLLLCSRIPLYTGKALAGPLAPLSFKPALSQAQVKPGQMHDPPAAPGRGWRGPQRVRCPASAISASPTPGRSLASDSRERYGFRDEHMACTSTNLGPNYTVQSEL